jgi:hypothetical protein
MMIKVPSTSQVRAPGYGGPLHKFGIGFLGDLGDTCVDFNGDPIDCPTFTTPTPVDSTPTPVNLPNVNSGGYQTISTSSGDYQLINGTLLDPNGNVVSTGIQLPSTQTAGMTTAQIAASLSTLANSAINAYRQTIAPSVVPGSNLVYNPATGQFLPAAGVSLSTAGIAGISSSALMVGGLALLALVLVMRSGR